MSRRPLSLAEALADSIGRQIADGAFRLGDRLPSIRTLAQDQCCSKNTVIEAFERLISAGQIEPRRGSGFFVIQRGSPATRDDEPSSLEQAVDIVSFMREQLKEEPSKLNMGDGFPRIEWLEDTRLDKYHQKVVRTGLGSLFRYGSRHGYLPLRQRLIRSLANLGIDSTPGQIVLTQGANQAMDVIIQYFIRPGDSVLVDDPGYYPLFGKLKLRGANIIGVPRLPDGPDVIELEKSLEALKPKLFFTQSVAHNPTGSDISPAKAHRVLQLAEKHNLIIVEDDPFADFKPATMTRISTLDQLQRTIYLGSFSKSISAALRVGFIACHPDLASELADIKMLIHVSSSEYCERMVEVIMNEGNYSHHVNRLRDRLEQATEASARFFADLGAQVFNVPKQTLFLWATLPGKDDSIKLAREYFDRNVVMAPGNIFSVDNQQKNPWCRYNVGIVSDPRFVNATVAVLGKNS